MGIPALWEVIKPGFDRRISIDEFVDHYLKENGRPPRVAIDAYMFLFEAGTSNINVDDPEDILTQNFMSKILSLIGLNISVVVVFDGNLKPKKTRNGEFVQSDYESEIIRLENSKSFDEGNPKIYRLKQILRQNKIDYVQAAGEAEAQCAFLQSLGIVDYVISNDVDALVFGAAKVLRNFSRIPQEEMQSPSRRGDGKPATTYYVTPVDMENVERITGLSRARLVFLATIRGGDYSTGIDRIGIKMATYLALCGTKFSKYHTRSPSKQELKDQRKNGVIILTEEPPDFANQLIRCFVSETSTSLIKSWELRLEAGLRRRKILKFLETLNLTIREQPRDIFGSAFKFNHDLGFDEQIVMLYLFPLVNTECHIFVPNTLSFGEYEIDATIKVPKNLFVKVILGIETVARKNETTLAEYSQKITYSGMFPSEMVDMTIDGGLPKSIPKLFVPSSYCFHLKHIICRLITIYGNGGEPALIKLTNIKQENGVEKCMLKYELKGICELFPLSIESKKINNPESTSPLKNQDLQYVWVPKSIVEHYAPKMIESFTIAREEYEYTKKHKASPQKTRLDSFAGISLSPTKLKSIPPPERRRAIPFDIPKGSTKRSNKKLKPLPEGQKQLDFFVKKPPNRQKHSENPFLEKPPQLPRLNSLSTPNLQRSSESEQTVNAHKDAVEEYPPSPLQPRPRPSNNETQKTVTKPEVIEIDSSDVSDLSIIEIRETP